MGNIFAGLKTKIMGNERPVSKVEFIRTIKSFIA